MMQARIHLATQLGRGGVSILLLTASPEQMREVDRNILNGKELKTGELGYGWLTDSGERIDEVLLAAPEAGQRILTGHGGTASALAILQYYLNKGFTESTAPSFQLHAPDLELLLPECRTTAQVARVLRAMQHKITEGLTDFLRTKRWCLTGAPNTGKSSLLNRLCDSPRVLVSPLAGTTLDAVEHGLDVGGHYCILIDTAGLRSTAGETEREAMRRARIELTNADLVACLLDASRPLHADDRLALAQSRTARHLLLLLNKSDKMLPEWEEGGEFRNALHALLPDSTIRAVCSLPDEESPYSDGICELLATAATYLNEHGKSSGIEEHAPSRPCPNAAENKGAKE